MKNLLLYVSIGSIIQKIQWQKNNLFVKYIFLTNLILIITCILAERLFYSIFIEYVSHERIMNDYIYLIVGYAILIVLVNLTIIYYAPIKIGLNDDEIILKMVINKEKIIKFKNIKNIDKMFYRKNSEIKIWCIQLNNENRINISFIDKNLITEIIKNFKIYKNKASQ